MSLTIGKKGSSSFYTEKKAIGVGNYLWDSLIAEIESLSLFASIHAREYGVYRMLSKRFPYAIYYEITYKIQLFRHSHEGGNPERFGVDADD